jgi:hypothetical protein
MDFETAKEVFQSRFYGWALDDMRREIAEEFRLIRMVKGRVAIRTIHYFQNLLLSDQLELFEAMLKRFHKPNSLTSQENAVLARKDEALLRSVPIEVELEGEPYGEERIPRMNRSRFAALANKELSSVLGPEVTRSGVVATYRTTIEPWILSTVVSYGSPPYYFQHIELPQRKPLMQHVSVLLWLGISSQTTWDVARLGDEKETASSIATLCAHFLAAAPRLLSGLGTVADSRA